MAKTNIILVEDDKILSKVIYEELKENGFSVEQVYDGVAGLDLVSKKQPDLVLLDLILPQMGGFKVLEKLKNSPATRDIPVIVLTMLGKDEDIKEGLRLGASDYIVKSQHAVAEIIEKISDFFQDESHPGAMEGGESKGPPSLADEADVARIRKTEGKKNVEEDKK